jgi:hypothetical protein
MADLENNSSLCDLWSDIWISVTVATDPCTKGKWTSGNRKLDSYTLEFVGKFI